MLNKIASLQLLIKEVSIVNIFHLNRNH